MSFQPSANKPMQAAPARHAAPEPDVVAVQPEVIVDDGLDGLDKEQLHALARDRGVKVHHMAGADKVRAALREAA
jgi:arginase family enzyme